MTTGEYIKQLRRGRYRKDFAELLGGVDDTSVYRWETGKANPSEENRQALYRLALRENRTDIAKHFLSPGEQLLVGSSGIPAPGEYPVAHRQAHDAVEKAIRAGVPVEQIIGALVALQSQLPKRRSVVGE